MAIVPQISGSYDVVLDIAFNVAFRTYVAIMPNFIPKTQNRRETFHIGTGALAIEIAAT
jgi:hypothetical protein